MTSFWESYLTCSLNIFDATLRIKVSEKEQTTGTTAVQPGIYLNATDDLIYYLDPFSFKNQKIGLQFNLLVRYCSENRKEKN